jgi:hypothetical protein
MGTLVDWALAVRVHSHKRLTVVGAIVRQGLWAFLRVRDVWVAGKASRNPVIRLQPRRVARQSPCGGWFVIMPLPSIAKRNFQARHAIGMGSLGMNRHAD